ncbi:MAG: GYF domain-containing protein [Planctomycetaceae bacterium]|jgi:hypothetical protein|nr:GYF domain-containing protein [Planctomycetaceae bacterium]
MTNYYYYDNIGQKHGPIDFAQLKMLALQGVITPETIVENENGKIQNANEVNGLQPLFPQSKTESLPHSQTDDLKSTKFWRNFFLKWLLDFQFNLCYFFIVQKTILKIVYFLYFVASIIAGVVGIFAVGFQFSGIAGLFILTGILIGIILSLVLVRLGLEFYIFTIDWFVDTRQAAQRIIASPTITDTKPD